MGGAGRATGRRTHDPTRVLLTQLAQRDNPKRGKVLLGVAKPRAQLTPEVQQPLCSDPVIGLQRVHQRPLEALHGGRARVQQSSFREGMYEARFHCARF
jgi:hypothetical protein